MYPSRVRLQGEDQEEIVGEAHQEGSAFQARLDRLFEPLVQYLMEIDVGEYR